MFQKKPFIIPIFVLFLIISGSTVLLIAHDIVEGVNDTAVMANNAYDVYDGKYKYYIKNWMELIVLEAERGALTVAYDSNASEMKRLAIEASTAVIPTGFPDILSFDAIKDLAEASAKIAITYGDDLALKKALVEKTIEIQKKKVLVAEGKEAVDTTYEHYKDHVNAYNHPDCIWNSPTTVSDDLELADKGPTPSDEIGVDTNLSVPCSNPKCDTVYTVGDLMPNAQNPNDTISIHNVVALSEGHHLYTCSKKRFLPVCRDRYKEYIEAPDKWPSGQCSESYWVCPNDVNECSKRSSHALPCRGGCGDLFPRYGSWGSPVPADFSHRTNCKEQAYKYWSSKKPKPKMECLGYYYHCNGKTSDDCPNAKNHVGKDDDEDTTPAVFSPRSSLIYVPSTGSVSMTVSANEPIYGVQLYMRIPGDTSKYGKKYNWKYGNSNQTTYNLPTGCKLPSSAGTYKLTLRVYPFNNSGTGNKWGSPVDVFKYVKVE